MGDVIRILLVDDHFVARIGLRSIVAAQPGMEIVAEARNGAEALELHRQHQPDVTVMDLRMPGLNGLDAIAAIRAEVPAARIVVLSNYEGVEDVHRALSAGALAYLLKSANAEEIVAAIQSAHLGRRYLNGQLNELLAERFDADALTARELDVLRMLAEGCSNREVGHALSIAENTVRIHVARILQKLGVEDRTQAVIAAIRRGIVHVN